MRSLIERFLASGPSDSQLYLVCAELVSSAALIPFFSASKSAAISGQTVSKELHLQNFRPTQKGHPDGCVSVPSAWASLPAVHLVLGTFMALPPNELAALQCCVIRKVSIFSVPVMIPLLQQGMVCPCKCGVLLPCAVCFPAAICLCTLGAAGIAPHLRHHWSLPLIQAKAALPMDPHVAGHSHLVWGQRMVVLGIPKQCNFRCISGKCIVLTNSLARARRTAPSIRPVVNSSLPDMRNAIWTLVTRLTDLAIAGRPDENVAQVHVALFMPLFLQLISKQARVGPAAKLQSLLLCHTVSSGTTAIGTPCKQHGTFKGRPI